MSSSYIRSVSLDRPTYSQSYELIHHFTPLIYHFPPLISPLYSLFAKKSMEHMFFMMFLHKNNRCANGTPVIFHQSVSLRLHLHVGWTPDTPRSPTPMLYFYSVFFAPAPADASAVPCPSSPTAMSSVRVSPPRFATFLRMTMIHTADTAAITAPTTIDTGT